MRVRPGFVAQALIAGAVVAFGLWLVAPGMARAATFAQVREQLLARRLSPPPLYPSQLPTAHRGANVHLYGFAGLDYVIDFGSPDNRDCHTIPNLNAWCVDLRRSTAPVSSWLKDPALYGKRRMRVGSRTVWFFGDGGNAGGWWMLWSEQDRTYAAWAGAVADPAAAARRLAPFVKSLRPLTSPPPRALSILVLGDSYSAGNGAGDYFGPKGCWRSHRNYAEEFARLIGRPPSGQPATVTNAACSGATTRWFSHSVSGRPPELDAVNPGFDLIFLTVGGDDIDFKDIVQNCLVQISRDGAKCNTLLSAASRAMSDGSLTKKLTGVLDGIHRRAGAHTRIVLLGYPYIEGQESYLLPWDGHTPIDVPARLRGVEDHGDQVQSGVIDHLNRMYRTTNFVFVNTKALFAGHELLARRLNPDRWFVAPRTDAGLAYLSWWYHPNPTGWDEEAVWLLGDPRVPKHPLP
jgi:hypothetical protein